MKKEQLFEAVGGTEDIYLLRCETIRARQPLRALAACIVLALLAGTAVLLYNQGGIALSDASRNVTVRYTDQAESINAVMELTPMTEQELFSKWSPAVLRGTVTSIRNIEIRFNGMKEYRALAQIMVEKVYRGSCVEGSSVSVLLPCPVADGVWVEDTATVAAMRPGMGGIFMIVEYDAHSVWEQNGAALCKKDLADYGFADGSRYAFLQTDNGLIFDRSAYAGIAQAKTLDEIEDYVQRMLRK